MSNVHYLININLPDPKAKPTLDAQLDELMGLTAKVTHLQGIVDDLCAATPGPETEGLTSEVTHLQRIISELRSDRAARTSLRGPIPGVKTAVGAGAPLRAAPVNKLEEVNKSLVRSLEAERRITADLAKKNTALRKDIDDLLRGSDLNSPEKKPPPRSRRRLTDEEVHQVRSYLASGRSPRWIAQRMHMSVSAISKLKTGISYAHVPPAEPHKPVTVHAGEGVIKNGS